jgi:hypothetical protein
VKPSPEPTALPPQPASKSLTPEGTTVRLRKHAAPVKSASPVIPTVNNTRVNISDELGALISEAACNLRHSSSWDSFVQKRRHTIDMHAKVADIPQPASHIIHQYLKRVALVTMRTLPWSRQRKDAAINRGAHLSAKQHVAFLQQEFASMIKKGQWTVLPARLVRHMRKLRISPIRVVPQRDRRPRTIVDYSFCDVNEDTAPWAPSKAMQFGRALHRILRRILEVHPRFGPVYISKVDIADGFIASGCCQATSQH